jgi:hypothetical protein
MDSKFTQHVDRAAASGINNEAAHPTPGNPQHTKSRPSGSFVGQASAALPTGSIQSRYQPMTPVSRSTTQQTHLLHPNYVSESVILRRLSEISEAQSNNSNPMSVSTGFSSPGLSSAGMSDGSTGAYQHRKRKRAASPSAFQRQKYQRWNSQSIRDTSFRGYVAELNKDIWDADEGLRNALPSSTNTKQSGQLNNSQIGGTVWSGDDKERFFNALSIYGKDDVISIAAAVGNGMGPVQVREYIMILDDASIEYKRKIGPRRWKRMRFDDQPAAVDISIQLMKALKKAAKEIEDRCLREEERTELRKWGRYWLLDDEVAEKVLQEYALEDEASSSEANRHIKIDTKDQEQKHTGRDIYGNPPLEGTAKNESGDETNNPSILNSIPAANLLHLPNFLRLSNRVYMNFPPEKRRRWMLRCRDPSMRQTAFSDFHNLVISVTRRIVSVVLFQAESALRQKHPPTPKTVRAKDVFTALDILGMRRDLVDYWITIPRNYGLTVKVPSTGKRAFEKNLKAGVISYEDTEEALKKPVGRRWGQRRVNKQGGAHATKDSDDEKETPEDQDVEESHDDQDAQDLQDESDGGSDEEEQTDEIDEINEMDETEESEGEDSESQEIQLLPTQKRMDEHPNEFRDDNSSSGYSSDTQSDAHPYRNIDPALLGETTQDTDMDDVSSNTAPPSVSNALEDASTQDETMDDNSPSPSNHMSPSPAPQTIEPAPKRSTVSFVLPEQEAVQEQALDENEDSDEDLLFDQDKLTREEILAIYPAVFDTSHRTSSRWLLNRQIKVIRAMLADEDAEEEYLEERDERQSEREQQRLWNVLQDEHGITAKAAFDWSGIAHQKEKEELLKLGSRMAAEWSTERPGDWRDHTDYVARWERTLMRPAKQ